MIKRRVSSSKAEWKYIGELIECMDIPTSPSVKPLIENLLIWYVVKAKQYKILEYILNLITMITPTLILIFESPFSENSIEGQILVSIVGTIAASIKSFSIIHEKRINYRKTVEKIKTEIILYINETEKYEGDDRTDVFIQKICELQDEEHAKWVEAEEKNGKLIEHH